MSDMAMEILKLLASFLTPLLILIFGIVINKKLESVKADLSKEKDWQNWWAGKLLGVSHDYNENVSNLISGLFQLNDKNFFGGENEIENALQVIRQNLRNLSYLEWEIQNYSQFASQHGAIVSQKAKELMDLIASLIRKKQGNLEQIRQVQFEFNNAVRLAHGEILGLAPNLKLNPTLVISNNPNTAIEN